MFYIGQKETTVAVGPEEGQISIPDIKSIRLEGQDVCEYYKSYTQSRY